jgi:RNA polymerase sigma factor (sigma-70 family)
MATSGPYKKNDFRDVDDMVYEIRQCAYVNGFQNCGETVNCRCGELKLILLDYFQPMFYKLMQYHAGFNVYCYSFKEDFEQELKNRFLYLIYDWDDKRGIYFVKFVAVMIGRWMLKVHHTELTWDKRKYDNIMLYALSQPEKQVDAQIIKLHSEDQIGKMMKNLTPKQRLVLEARYLDQLMVNEVANMMEISPGAVSNLLKRAYRSIKDTNNLDNDDIHVQY